ncbi:MAG: SDR family oxidoreductase [Truepera sp.]|nr:SDR family oxidoreductase [Truepera sp.]
MKRSKVVITGASSGIGKATAVRFAQEGWDVCLLARREALLQEVAAELQTGDHLLVPGSYDDPARLQTVKEVIRQRWGRVDALVNSAGVFAVADSLDAPLSEWRRPLDVMLNGAVLITRTVVPLMPEGGRIIHITSIHGERAEQGSSAYAMAKAAINQYCRSLALELAPRKILVNALAPGFVATAMSVVNGVDELETAWFRDNYIAGHHLPLRRAAKPEEIAGVAYFLAGPDASYITGQIITVDGGLTITF